jgi:hypothetical protein
MITVGRIRRACIEALEDEFGSEFSGIDVVKGGNKNGESSVKHEEFFQEIGGQQGLLAQDESEADYEYDGYEAKSDKVEKKKEQNQKDTFPPLLALDLIKIQRGFFGDA